MSQNLLSLTFSDAALAEIDAALNTLETHFTGFASLSPDQRRNILKMGDKTEAFCRQTMLLGGQNAQAIPPNLNMAEAQADMTSLDQLRPRLHRLRDLQARGDDTDMALGSDIYSFCLDAYASLKIAGKGAALETLRQAMAVRFNRGAKSKVEPAAG
ncbi:hypothetical protein [Methylomonas sp. MK1]|uniref:hypothetical protein n=1 Tax=Methylomonas sp. MK1 TaxID=1131552 RepID=UPI0003804C46|nr:hypothetical protein [Methylomonas sp. MK1]